MKAKPGLLSALADRGDAAAKPAVLKLIDDAKDAKTRIAAITAMGKLGVASDCPKLVALLENSDESAVNAATRSLTVLPGADVNDAIVMGLNQSQSPKLKVALIEILTSRRALKNLPTLMVYAVRNDAKVRAAAMAALGELGDATHVSGMVRGILKAKPGKERANAEKQVMFVCKRIEDKDKRAQPILNAMGNPFRDAAHDRSFHPRSSWWFVRAR